DGPQDLTMTDGGNDVSRLLSEKLGGHVLAHCTIRWTRLLRPFGTGAAVVGRRSRRSPVEKSLRMLAVPLDAASIALAGHSLIPHSSAIGEPLTIHDIVALLPDVARAFDLHVDYDEEFLS